MLANLNYSRKIKHYTLNKLKNRYLFKPQIIDPNFSDNQIRYRYKNNSVQDYENILNTPATRVYKEWGGRSPVFYNYNQSYLDTLSTQVNFFNGSPEIKNFTDVIYMPQYHCLYSSDGLRINYSCLYRGAERNELITRAPDEIDPPKELKKISQKFIYIGNLREHYGHFLVESIARLWYTIKDEKHAILCHGLKNRGPSKTFIDHFFQAVNFDKRRFVSFKSPVLLENVIVPYPSFSIKCEGFEVHKLIPENIATHFLQKTPKITGQPLYFSRRCLDSDKRLVINEDKLEKELQRQGFAIYYPEQLSLKQQIYLINKHEVVVGTAGSALHNVLYDISASRNLVCFTYEASSNTNFFIIDALKSVNSSYISALVKDPNCSKQNDLGLVQIK